MRRFLEKKSSKKIIQWIKFLGILTLLFIHFMILPIRADSKEAAILNTTIDGEIELGLGFIESEQRKVFSKNFNLLDPSKVKSAYQSVEKILGTGSCSAARCLRLMSQILGIKTLFVLRIKQINNALQLSLISTQNNEMQIVDDFCHPCTQAQFKIILTQLSASLINNEGNYAKLSLPLDLSLPSVEYLEMQIEMPVAPLDPLPPIDAELLYPSIAKTVDLESNLSEIEIPDPEIPNAPETPKDLSELQSTQEDILIFPLSKDLVQEEKGEFAIQVSAFSEIKKIMVNQEKQPFTPGIYEESIRFPYKLQPGENVFLVEIETRLGRSKKEFIVFLETDKVKREKEKPPFQMIIISEVWQDDNFLSVAQGNSKTKAQKGSLTLLSSFNKHFDHESRMALNAMLMRDGYKDKAFSDYAVFFK